MKQNQSYHLSFSLAAMSMAAYTPNKIYQTLLKTVNLILFPLKSVGRDLGSLVSPLSHSAIYSVGCAQGDVHLVTQKQYGWTILFNVASALWLLLASHRSSAWWEKCKGTATLLPAIQDAEVTTLILAIACKRKRDMLSRLPSRDQWFLWKTWQKPSKDVNRRRRFCISVYQLCCTHQLPNHRLVLLCFSSLKPLKTTDGQYYKYISCSGLKPGPEIPRRWRWSVVTGFKDYRVSVT